MGDRGELQAEGVGDDGIEQIDADAVNLEANKTVSEEGLQEPGPQQTVSLFGAEFLLQVGNSANPDLLQYPFFCRRQRVQARRQGNFSQPLGPAKASSEAEHQKSHDNYRPEGFPTGFPFPAGDFT